MLLYSTFLMLALAWSVTQDVCPVILVKPLCALALLQPVGLIFDASNQAININSLASTLTAYLHFFFLFNTLS